MLSVSINRGFRNKTIIFMLCGRRTATCIQSWCGLAKAIVPRTTTSHCLTGLNRSSRAAMHHSLERLRYMRTPVGWLPLPNQYFTAFLVDVVTMYPQWVFGLFFRRLEELEAESVFSASRHLKDLYTECRRIIVVRISRILIKTSGLGIVVNFRSPRWFYSPPPRSYS